MSAAADPSLAETLKGPQQQPRSTLACLAGFCSSRSPTDVTPVTFGRRGSEARSAGLVELGRRTAATAYRLACLVVRLGPSLLRSALPCGAEEEDGEPAPLNARLRRGLERWEPAFSRIWRDRAAGGQAVHRNAPVVAVQDCVAARRVILEELRMDAGKLFEIPGGREAPVVASEVAHIFRWRLHGQDVAVKVQRRCLREDVMLDLRVLQLWARVIALLARLVPSRCGGDTATTRTRQYISDLERCTRVLQAEFDYHQAARQQASFRNEVISHVPGAVLPGVCWEATAGRVLTTTWVEGVQLTDLGLRASSLESSSSCQDSSTGAGGEGGRLNLVANGMVVAPESVGSGALLSLALQVTSCPPFAPGDVSSKVSSKLSSAISTPRSTAP